VDSDEHWTPGDGLSEVNWGLEKPAPARGRDPANVVRGAPPRPRSRLYLTVFVVVAFAAAAPIAMVLLVTSAYHRVEHDLRGPVGAPASSPGWAARDVTVICGDADAPSGPLTASVTIVNHGSDTANYLVAVNFADGSGTSIGGGSAQTDSVSPGGTATLTVTGIAGMGTQSPSSCAASDVIRTIARS
jgi:hypothetical protein